MSLRSRREHLHQACNRYRTAATRAEKAVIIDELVQVHGYHRKYAITVLNRGLRHDVPVERPRQKRTRTRKYTEILYIIQIVWEALDYICAERLHPVLASTAQLLALHGELTLNAHRLGLLKMISRATLARRLAELPRPSARVVPRPKPSSAIKSEVPINRYRSDESRPGALEIDLVEHNGGDSSGHYAYTLTVTCVVTGWSRRRAVLGKSRAAVLAALKTIIAEYPFEIWAIHSDNGSEFLNAHLIAFVREAGLVFHRGRPGHKNDQPHVEQRNRQYVREVVGHGRYDTDAEVDWLNRVYTVLDVYANLLLPMRKLAAKEYNGAKARKTYDQARTPLTRLADADVLTTAALDTLTGSVTDLNPMAIKKLLEKLLAGPEKQPPATALKTDLRSILESWPSLRGLTRNPVLVEEEGAISVHSDRENVTVLS